MDSFTAHVGIRIRFFRKIQNLTVDQLAQRINKSKSAVSKYESGQISMDLETLSDIAKTLGINIYQLVYNKETPPLKTAVLCKLFGGEPQLYIYYYDGRKRRLVKSLLQLIFDEIQNKTDARYYLDVPAFDSYINSRYFYSGEIASYDTLTYFFLENQANSLERINLCVLNSLEKCPLTFGLLTGVINGPTVPAALKVLVSKNIISDDNLALASLKISKEDLKNIKETNMLIVYNS